jgi:hypothetical protein
MCPASSVIPALPAPPGLSPEKLVFYDQMIASTFYE